MSTILTRAGKGSALTHNEMDTNLKQGAQTKAIAYTIAESDNRDTIEYSGAGGVDFTMPDVATVVAAADTGDFEVTIKHVGTGTLGVTNTTGADTIDGSTNDLTLETNDVVTLKTNQGGDGYNIIAGETLNSVTQDNTVTLTNKTINTAAGLTHGARVIIEKQTASTDTSIDFTSNIDSTYDLYELEIINLIPATDAQTVTIRISDDTGSTWKAGATDYRFGGAGQSTAIALGLGISNVEAHGGMSAKLFFNAPSNASVKTSLYGTSLSNAASSSTDLSDGGRYDTAAATDGIRVIMSSGSIVSGEFRLYGII